MKKMETVVAELLRYTHIICVFEKKKMFVYSACMYVLGGCKYRIALVRERESVCPFSDISKKKCSIYD